MEHFGHFGAMMIFALLLSAATACLTQRTARARIQYAALSFGLLMIIGVAVAWLMYPFSK
jgi:hypothetical protein